MLRRRLGHSLLCALLVCASARLSAQSAPATITITETQQVPVLVTPLDKKGHPATVRTVTWSSSAPTVAAVTQDPASLTRATVKGIVPGAALISARVNNVSFAVLSVTVIAASVPPPPPAPPTLTFQANPVSIALGQPVTLSWAATDATLCTAFEDWGGPRPTVGSEIRLPGNTGTWTYRMSCTGPAGSVAKSVSVPVTAAPPPPPVCTAPCVPNPTGVDFTASADHAVLLPDGSPKVTSYEFSAMAMNSSGALMVTRTLGKPVPNTVTGCNAALPCVRVAVPELATITSGQLYTATVTAVGPGNPGVSIPSNTFMRTP